jgi:hypothetical protein
MYVIALDPGTITKVQGVGFSFQKSSSFQGATPYGVRLASLSISRFFDQVRKDGKGVLLIMSTNRLRDCLGRRSTQLLGARGLDGGRPPGSRRA